MRLMILRGPRVVTPDGAPDGVLDAEVVVADGRIAALRSRTGEPAAELGAGWLVPGFVDIHCHGGGGASLTAADPDEVRAAAAFHAGHGTTRLLASLVTDAIDALCAQLAVIADVVADGTTVLAGAHLEGPFLSAARSGAQNPAHLASPDADTFARLLDAARGTLRMITLAPELPGADAVIDAALAAGVVVAVGHTDADFETTVRAFERGATVATHLFNGMPKIDTRAPGPAIAAVERAAFCELINDGHHVHPAMQRLVGADRTVLVTDAMVAAGTGDGHHELGGLAVMVRDGVARLESTGSLAGSTLTMDVAVRRAVHEVGRSMAQVAAAAATNPARAVGLEAGAITAGGRADLVHLDEQLRVRHVVRDGRITRSP